VCIDFDHPRAKRFTSAKIEPKKLGFKDSEELQAFYEKYRPGITSEIQGLADSFGAERARRMPNWVYSFQPSIRRK